MIYEYDIALSELNQCDVFKEIHFNCESGYYFAILLTPECDLVIQEGKSKPKADYLKFAAIVDFTPILDSIISQLKITKKQKKGEEYIDQVTFNDLLISLKQFINGGIYPRYYYLPPLSDHFMHSVIDFQFIEVKKFSFDLQNELCKKKIANISSSWKESIPVKYANYSSRIGVKDISPDIIDKILTDYNLEFNIS
jgi:hypothetical protein